MTTLTVTADATEVLSLLDDLDGLLAAEIPLDALGRLADLAELAERAEDLVRIETALGVTQATTEFLLRFRPSGSLRDLADALRAQPIPQSAPRTVAKSSPENGQ